jgi:hypothetical protein
MRRRAEPHTFDDRLSEEKARIEAELEATEPGPQRDFLGLMLSQIETALHIDRWRHRLTSTDIRALLIDPFACKLSEVNIHPADLDVYRELLSHPTMPVMEVSAPIEMPDVCQSHVALVDENGMIHWCERYWWIGPTDVDHHPLAGKGLIVGAPDADGKFTSCRSTIATLREEVFFSKSPATDDWNWRPTSTPWAQWQGSVTRQ